MSKVILRLLLLTIAILVLSMLSACSAPDIEKLQEKGDIKGLIGALGFDKGDAERYDDDIREKAYSALLSAGELAVEPLIDAINDKNKRISSSVIRLLSEIKDPRAIEPLIKALDYDQTKENALHALCLFGDINTVNVLKNYMSEKSVVEGGLVEINVKYVQPVILGQGVESAPYNPEAPGPHPVVITDERPFERFRLATTLNDPENWNALMPLAWQALGDPKSIQLVLCWGEFKELTLEKVRYGGNIVGKRIQEEKTVILREAYSGKIIATDTILGEIPRTFPQFISRDRKDFTLKGIVTADILIAWLAPYVEGSHY